MKNIGLLCIVLLCVSGLAPLAPVAANPTVKLSEETWEVGKIYQGQSREREFVVANEGDQDLIVQNMARSCGCTTTQKIPFTVPPGGNATLTVIYDADMILGEKATNLTLYTNDPAHPEAVIQIKADVTADLIADPPYLFFPELKKNAVIEKTIILDSSPEHVVVIRDVTPSNSSIKTQLQPDPLKKGRYKLTISMVVAGAIGPLDERVIVATDSENQKELIIPLRGLLRGDLTIRPNRLYLKAKTSDSVIERKITITNEGKVPLEIPSITSDISNLHCTLRVIRPGLEYNVEVKLTPPFEELRIKGQIQIRTNNPQQAEILIPVTCNLSSAKEK